MQNSVQQVSMHMDEDQRMWKVKTLQMLEKKDCEFFFLLFPVLPLHCF